MSLFNFFDMTGNYEQRKVDHTDLGDNIWVDTAAVNDSEKPYETAVQHPRYNDNKMVIVELYGTKVDAQTGHDRWVKVMSTEPLPESLKDVSTCGLALLCDVFGGKSWRDK